MTKVEQRGGIRHAFAAQINAAELGPRHRASICARKSALRVERPCFSNPLVASVICFIAPSLVIELLRPTLSKKNRSLLIQCFPNL
jgi:hypothetical protein